jgi:hypothetical protein
MRDINKRPSKDQLLAIKLAASLWGMISIIMLLSVIIAYNFVRTHIFGDNVPVQDISGINPITIAMVSILCEIASRAFGLFSVLCALTSIGLFSKRRWGIWCSYLSWSLLISSSGFLVYIDIFAGIFPCLSFVGLPGICIASLIMYCLLKIS